MPERDWFQRLLARVLPWFDQAEFDAETRATRQTLAESRALRGPGGRTELMRRSFQHGDRRLGGR